MLKQELVAQPHKVLQDMDLLLTRQRWPLLTPLRLWQIWILWPKSTCNK